MTDNLIAGPSQPQLQARGRKAPGPRGIPLLGSWAPMRWQGMLKFWTGVWRDYGDVAHVKMGPIDTHLIVHPEHVHNVLVRNRDNYARGILVRRVRVLFGAGLLTSEGELWMRQRRLMQPIFQPTTVPRFAQIMLDAAASVVADWQARPQPQRIPLNAEMMDLTRGVITEAMFSVNMDQQLQEVGEALSYIPRLIRKRATALLNLPLFLPVPTNLRFHRSLQTIDAFIEATIAHRRAMEQGHEQAPDDLLSLLLRARDTETDGRGMSDQQVHDELLTIFIAGHETSAQVLTWLWYILATHPEVEQQLHAELESVLHGHPATLADLPKLIYTKMVIDEALRLYPPAPMYAREAVADDEMGGFRIPAGSAIMLSPYITHRHPAFWDDPEQFRPERFAAGREPRLVEGYFPFGGGPHVCIGKHFALLEITLALTTLAQRFRLHLLPGQHVRPHLDMFLTPEEEIWMTIEPR